MVVKLPTTTVTNKCTLKRDEKDGKNSRQHSQVACASLDWFFEVFRFNLRSNATYATKMTDAISPTSTNTIPPRCMHELPNALGVYRTVSVHSIMCSRMQQLYLTEQSYRKQKDQLIDAKLECDFKQALSCMLGSLSTSFVLHMVDNHQLPYLLFCGSRSFQPFIRKTPVSAHKASSHAEKCNIRHARWLKSGASGETAAFQQATSQAVLCLTSWGFLGIDGRLLTHGSEDNDVQKRSVQWQVRHIRYTDWYLSRRS